MTYLAEQVYFFRLDLFLPFNEGHERVKRPPPRTRAVRPLGGQPCPWDASLGRLLQRLDFGFRGGTQSPECPILTSRGRPAPARARER